MAEISQKIMIFEKNINHENSRVKFLKDKYLTFKSDNLYQFLKYAKEIKPNIVIMHLPDGFDCTQTILKHFKENLCEADHCPKIYLNVPESLENNPHFYPIDFKGRQIDEDFVFNILQSTQTSNYLNEHYGR